MLATVRSASDFAPTAESPVFWGPGTAPDHYYQMVFGDVSANLLEAFRNALPEPLDFDTLGNLAAAATGNQLTLPREWDTPELLEHVRTWAKTENTGEAVRAILEGVAKALDQQVKQLCGAKRPPAIHSVGGAAKSNLWMQIKANTVGVPFRAVACEEPTSLGAALLAVHGLTDEPLDKIATDCVQLKTTITPNR